MINLFIKVFGWPAIVWQADIGVLERSRWLRRHLLPGSHRTLDAGCGAGVFTLYAGLIGNEAIGISHEESLNEIGRVRASLLRLPNVEFLTADLRELDQFANQLGQFSQIICLETIEHILNDKKLIADLSRLLKPGGYLYLTTPFKHYKPLLGDKLSEHEDGGHVRWGYTHAEMRELFESQGLKIGAAENLGGVIAQQLISLTRILSQVNGRVAWLLVSPLRLLLTLDPWVTRLIQYPYLNIGIVGQKHIER